MHGLDRYLMTHDLMTSTIIFSHSPWSCLYLQSVVRYMQSPPRSRPTKDDHTHTMKPAKPKHSLKHLYVLVECFMTSIQI